VRLQVKSEDRGLDDVVGVDASVGIQIGDRSALAEGVDTEGHDRRSEHTAEERERVGGPVGDGHDGRAALALGDERREVADVVGTAAAHRVKPSAVLPGRESFGRSDDDEVRCDLLAVEDADRVDRLGDDRARRDDLDDRAAGRQRLRRVAGVDEPVATGQDRVTPAIETETRLDLLTQNGFLAISGAGQRSANHGVARFLDATVAAAKSAKVNYELLDSVAIYYRRHGANVTSEHGSRVRDHLRAIHKSMRRRKANPALRGVQGIFELKNLPEWLMT